MKKTVLLTCMLMLFIAASVAVEAEFGMKFGLTIGNAAFDPEFDTLEEGWDDVMLFGITEGLIVWFPLGEKTDIQTELILVQKGDKYTDEDDDYDVMLRLNYISLPILFRYHFNDVFAAYAGPGFNYFISGIFKYYDDDGFEAMFIEEIAKKIEIDLSAGVQYMISDKVFTDLRYSYGLTNIIDGKIYDEAFDGKTSTLSLTAGYKF